MTKNDASAKQSTGQVMVTRQHITLPYGKEQISFSLPSSNLAGIYAPRQIPGCADPIEEIKTALDHPLDTPPVEDLVQPTDRVVVIIDDYTRPTPVSMILPALAQRLNLAGVADDQITLLVATGTHRPCSPEELRQKLGSELISRFRLEQHDCYEIPSQVFQGVTSRGTPVWVNRLLVDADRVFGIGHIDPSDYAGYAGGHKLIVPGVAALETIDTNHSLATLSFRRSGDIEVACRRDLEEAAGMVRTDLIINTILNQDGGIVRVFAGTPGSVYLTGVAVSRQVYEVPCPGGLDIGVASAFPYDVDLYQAIRAIECADAAVRPGGSILLAAPCPDGIGSPVFYRLLSDPEAAPDHFLRKIARRDGKVTYNVLGYYLSRIRLEKKIYAFIPGISGQEIESVGFTPVNDLQSGIDNLLDQYGPEAQVAVFPVGSATVPRRC
jgi:nickel-dependent lactate racemase